ncbi:hypothetical protein BWU74_03465 [Paraburkholderia caledonica]|nr:hypothetical protein BWU74_03465 [Burkholderia sp. Bk]
MTCGFSPTTNFANAVTDDLPLLPVIIGTLQQSGQDGPNLGRTFNIAADSIGEREQIFTATKRLPAETVINGVDVQIFETRQGLLHSDMLLSR